MSTNWKSVYEMARTHPTSLAGQKALPCPETFRATHAAQLGARLTVLVAEVNIIHQGQTHGHRQQVKEVVIPSQDNQYLQ